MPIPQRYKLMAPFIFVVIGSLVTIIAAFVEYRNKIKEAEENAQQYAALLKQTNEILKKNQAIIASQGTVIETTQKIISLEEELKEKNAEIARIQANTLDQVTGGSNIPHLKLIPMGNSIAGSIKNLSDQLPVRNITFYLNEMFMDEFVDNGNGTRTSNSPNAQKEQTLIIGDLGVKSNSPLIENKYPKIYKEIMYWYTVRWLNGFYTGVFTATVDNGVVKLIDNRLLNYSKGLDLRDAVIIGHERPIIQQLTDK